MTEKEALRKEILELVGRYCDMEDDARSYRTGDRIPYGGRVYDSREVTALVNASLDFWLTAGPEASGFESEFADFLNIRHCSLVNSGSSANLLAFMALTSPLLGDRKISRGDEVITVAAGFPTTVAPVVQYGAVPVFVDVSLPTADVDVHMLEDALSEKTKAVMIAHTLGNPFDLASVKDFCDSHNLWLVEDNCDALGSKYLMDGKWRYTGTIGHLGTSSFYPPHHMTMGEGGAVYTDDPLLHRIVRSMRDWGRDCTCPSGVDNSCGHRFTGRYGELPEGYDHKYVYSHLGYNLKATDLQAAIGRIQIEKLSDFVEARKKNWAYLRKRMDRYSDRLILPEATENSDPSWFGFLLTVRDGAGFSRDEAVRHLESRGIQTRMLFAGNLIKHPCFDDMRKQGIGYRQIGPLATTDRIMTDSFWIGVYPGLDERRLNAMAEAIEELCER
ncbi:lipopolysaccharide biosynthesis protein RfbH [Dethiosulfovibrio sp. F2B]|uniref:lipopolysaccharide biosynthesis protein RfbH n=1 Tax=Dethiosulfovibrio faecalis TaxID=2720018 RepID=UPI001F363B96|nr:lipopolysaccharide biosynthesis protein RfbH [Dethiosulfovibrio faecalis]MCF4150679.1 lipopolysaccharide biosynthesis protein RfbH [Dethiosulfovibrio faecalis]